MQLQIQLPKEKSKQEVINLKNFIDKTSIEGIASTDIDISDYKNGQMGAGDILNSITTIIEAAERPLIELVKCQQKFVENYRTEIAIPTKNGGNIILSHGRSMKAEQLQELVVAIQKSNE